MAMLAYSMRSLLLEGLSSVLFLDEKIIEIESFFETGAYGCFAGTHENVGNVSAVDVDAVCFYDHVGMREHLFCEELFGESSLFGGEGRSVDEREADALSSRDLEA